MTDKPFPWYLSRQTVWIGIILVGPFALPFVWMSPAFSTRAKWTLSLTTLVLTFLLVSTLNELSKMLNAHLTELQQVLNG